MANAARTSAPRSSQHRVFFVTIATHQRRPIFHISRVAEHFIDTLLQYRTRGDIKLHAFLVMPDHVHLLITPEVDTLDRTVALIENSFAQRIAATQSLWQIGFTAHPIRNLRDLEAVRRYLHQTPVRARLTTTAELYPYSSAHRQA